MIQLKKQKEKFGSKEEAENTQKWANIDSLITKQQEIQINLQTK